MKTHVLRMIMMVLIVSICQASLGDEYVPTHGMSGIEFGCSKEEFLREVSVNIPDLVEDPIISHAIISEQKYDYMGEPVTLRANFGEDDKLIAVILNCDTIYGYTNEDISSVAIKGISRLKPLLERITEKYGSAKGVYRDSSIRDATGEIITYEYPLQNGIPDYGAIETIIKAIPQKSIIEMIFYWDNLCLRMTANSYSGISISESITYLNRSYEMTYKDAVPLNGIKIDSLFY